MKDKTKGNKHLKVLVKYLGSQNDFRQNYLPTNTVNDPVSYTHLTLPTILRV